MHRPILHLYYRIELQSLQAFHLLVQLKAENSNASMIVGSLVCWSLLWVRQHLRLLRPRNVFICDGKCCTASPWRRDSCLFALHERHDLITLLKPYSPFISQNTHDFIETKLTHFSLQIWVGLSAQSCASAEELLSRCQQKKMKMKAITDVAGKICVTLTNTQELHVLILAGNSWRY